MRGHYTAARRDPQFEEAVHHLVTGPSAVFAQLDLIALPIWQQARRDMRSDQNGVPGEKSAIASGYRATPFEQTVQPIQLGKTDGRLNIGNAMVVTDLGIAFEPGRRPSMPVIVGQRHALLTQAAQLLGQARIIGGDHAPFGGGDHLARMQAEDTDVGQRPDRTAVAAAAEGAGGIIQHVQPVPAGQTANRVDIARQPELIDRHDRPRPAGDPARDIGGIDVVGSRVDLGENRYCADVADDVDRSDESERRYDHLVAGTDTPCVQHQEGPGCPARDPDRMLRAAQPRKTPLEFGQARPTHYPATTHDRRRRFRFGFTKARTAEGNGLVHPFISLPAAARRRPWGGANCVCRLPEDLLGEDSWRGTSRYSGAALARYSTRQQRQVSRARDASPPAGLGRRRAAAR